MFLLGILLLSAFSVCHGDPTPFLNCEGSTGLPPHYVKVGDCVSLPCVFQKYSTINININYTYPVAVSKPKLLVVFRSIIPVVLKYDGCDYGPCPVSAGQSVFYTFNQYIHFLVPLRGFTMVAIVLDDNNEPLFCGYLTGTVVL